MFEIGYIKDGVIKGNITVFIYVIEHINRFSYGYINPTEYYSFHLCHKHINRFSYGYINPTKLSIVWFLKQLLYLKVVVRHLADKKFWSFCYVRSGFGSPKAGAPFEAFASSQWLIIRKVLIEVANEFRAALLHNTSVCSIHPKIGPKWL